MKHLYDEFGCKRPVNDDLVNALSKYSVSLNEGVVDFVNYVVYVYAVDQALTYSKKPRSFESFFNHFGNAANLNSEIQRLLYAEFEYFVSEGYYPDEFLLYVNVVLNLAKLRREFEDYSEDG